MGIVARPTTTPLYPTGVSGDNHPCFGGNRSSVGQQPGNQAMAGNKGFCCHADL